MSSVASSKSGVSLASTQESQWSLASSNKSNKKSRVKSKKSKTKSLTASDKSDTKSNKSVAKSKKSKSQASVVGRKDKWNKSSTNITKSKSHPSLSKSSLPTAEEPTSDSESVSSLPSIKSASHSMVSVESQRSFVWREDGYLSRISGAQFVLAVFFVCSAVLLCLLGHPSGVFVAALAVVLMHNVMGSLLAINKRSHTLYKLNLGTLVLETVLSVFVAFGLLALICSGQSPMQWRSGLAIFAGFLFMSVPYNIWFSASTALQALIEHRRFYTNMRVAALSCPSPVAPESYQRPLVKSNSYVEEDSTQSSGSEAKF